MNAMIALIPLILVRIIVFRIINKEAYQQAQKFAPLADNQQSYYIVYQICQLLLLGIPFFYQVTFSSWVSFLGVTFYGLGLLVITLSVVGFSHSNTGGLRQTGIYRFSRHPMYVGYFLFYLGIGLMMHSYIYLTLLLVFQICTHQIILAEEKWCIEEFGGEYIDYMKKVSRYI